ncbi:MAG: hypothetical protein RLO81_14970, partial [Fulvivirga sp.]|uniref:hypothetical protein n=1 Tax=Fulvivirga sp. TaxID=1931237 RepID=UPI0032EE3C42
LIRTFNALQSHQGEELNNAFELLRKRRNVIMHSSPEFDISPKELIESTIQIISLFEGDDQWWSLIKQYHVDHPLFGWSDYDYELSHLLFRLQFIKNYSTLGYLNRYTTVELKSRKYLCPYCTKYLTDLGYSEEEIPRWSFLKPNKPTSNAIFCFSCQQNFEIEREPCHEDGCKGNVLYEGLCLTCNNY